MRKLSKAEVRYFTKKLDKIADYVESEIDPAIAERIDRVSDALERKILRGPFGRHISDEEFAAAMKEVFEEKTDIELSFLNYNKIIRDAIKAEPEITAHEAKYLVTMFPAWVFDPPDGPPVIDKFAEMERDVIEQYHSRVFEARMDEAARLKDKLVRKFEKFFKKRISDFVEWYLLEKEEFELEKMP